MHTLTYQVTKIPNKSIENCQLCTVLYALGKPHKKSTSTMKFQTFTCVYTNMTSSLTGLLCCDLSKSSTLVNLYTGATEGIYMVYTLFFAC